MNNYLKMILIPFSIMCISCSDQGNYKTEKISEFKMVKGKKELVGQRIRTIELATDRVITELTQIYNFNDDARLQSTGYFKKDGFQDYLLDSIFYDSIGNDVLKISYSLKNKKWNATQSFKKKYSAERKIEHFITERLNSTSDYRKEILYKYNKSGLVSSETEFECSAMVKCDSIFKKKYFYNLHETLDSIISYKWENNRWVEMKRNR